MTIGPTTSLPDPIRDCLRAFVAREGRAALLRAAGWGVAVGLAWAMGACLMDRVLRLPELIRAAMLLLGAALVAGIWLAAVRRTLGAYGDLQEAAAALERVEPRFAERLRTVVSQLAEREAYRGSPEMLQQLVRQVTRQIERTRPRRRAPWRRILAPWIVAAGAALALAGLWFVPVLGMPRLMARLTRPTAEILPASTTQIEVEPRGVRLLRGQPLLVKAHVKRLTGPSVDLLTSENGTLWTRIPMLPVSDGEYVLTLPELERDLDYFVEAGDGRSERYRAAVLRPPALAELRLRYDFPAYTQRPPLSIANSDGVIEALAGTSVQVTVIATEPLASAELVIGATRLSTVSAGESNVRQAEFVIDKDQSADLAMTSAGGLTAKISGALSIRAQVDRPPLVRMIEPANDLRLLPRAQVPIQYQVMDDYGVGSLAIEVRVNSTAPVEAAVPRRGDPRRQEGLCMLDLGLLDLKLGDVVALCVVARDAAGKKSASETRHILISPRSVDQNTHLRIADLKQAARITVAIREELRMAGDWLEKARKLVGGADEDYVAARARLRGSLSNAVEASLLLHQSLLRACAKSGSREQMIALADYVDQARVQAWLCDRLMTQESAGEAEDVLTGRLAKVADAARQLADSVKVLSEGDQAWAILAERGNLQWPATRPAQGPAQQTIQLAEQQMTAALQELGLKPSSRDLDKTLQRKVDAQMQLMQSCGVIDFEPAAQEWAAAVAKGQTPPPLVERLASASEAEAVCPEGDPVAARDLQIAGRAAARIAQMRQKLVAEQADHAEYDAALLEYPGLLDILQREHEFSRRRAEMQEDAAIARLAAEARVKMAQWAMETESGMLSELSGYMPAPEDLAMAASAATARRDYDVAEAMDRRLVKLVSPEPWATTQPNLARAMEVVRNIDEVSGEQRRLNEQTKTVVDEREAAELSRQQQAVAEKIHQADQAEATEARLAEDADSRRAATAAIQKVQEQLAHLPQQVAKAMEAAQSYRQAAARAEQTQNAAQGTRGEQQAVAQRAAEQAQRAMRDAGQELGGVCRDFTQDAAGAMAAQLKAFSPETDDAGQWLAQRIGPALATLQEALRTTDQGDAADRASTRLRSALETAQWLLSQAQSKIIESDPLVAARWFAESAAQSLAATPPDVPRAQGQQTSASTALGRAWQSAVQDVAGQRLALTPSLGPILGAGGTSLPQAAGRSLGEMLSGMRQWSFLRWRAPETSATPDHEADPAGYQDALRVYFDYLNKTQRGGKK